METVNLDELEEFSREYPVHVSTSEVLMHVLKGMKAKDRMVVLATIAPRP